MIKYFFAAASAFFVCTTGAAQDRPHLDVPYIKTPSTVVDRMLELAQVSADDMLIDLGSGDGRIPIAAAAKFGTRGLGVDLNPERTAEAQTAAKKQGVAEHVAFRTENLFDTDLSPATVISMYLFPEINLRLRPTLLNLKPGTRIVSHAFHMDDWTPEVHDIVDGRDIYLWTIPARVDGIWNVTSEDYPPFVLRLWQQFDRVLGTAITRDERSVPIRVSIHGPDITFTINTIDGVYTYNGKVLENTITGHSDKAGSWTAAKM